MGDLADWEKQHRGYFQCGSMEKYTPPSDMKACEQKSREQTETDCKIVY